MSRISQVPYRTRVQVALSEQGASKILNADEVGLIAMAEASGVDAHDCAWQIIINRNDAADRYGKATDEEREAEELREFNADRRSWAKANERGVD